MLVTRRVDMPKNYTQREKKLKARKDAMKVNSRGLLTVILPVIAKKGKEDSGTARRNHQRGR